mmetsp:Transcript_178095/g.570825  ORF Transcript_178095/g.570825 Transcript_178095/m.570825 type:complete len:227 (-) Transcript_178095:396-1076(-)
MLNEKQPCDLKLITGCVVAAIKLTVENAGASIAVVPPLRADQVLRRILRESESGPRVRAAVVLLVQLHHVNAVSVKPAIPAAFFGQCHGCMVRNGGVAVAPEEHHGYGIPARNKTILPTQVGLAAAARGDRGDPVAEALGQLVHEESAIGATVGEDPLVVDAELGLQRVQQMGDEGDIVIARRPIATMASPFPNLAARMTGTARANDCRVARHFSSAGIGAAHAIP